jgi:phospholipid-binding lipoprotein MlaA
MILRSLSHFLICFLAVFSLNAFAVDEPDPLQPLNQIIFYLNEMTFSLYIKPAATAYDTVAPLPVKEGVKNIIRNVRCCPHTVNNFLQGKFEQGFKSAARLLVNTTLGLGGIFDVATALGLPEYKETLGDTLYAWGWKKSSYLMVPLVGPCTIRDAWGLAGDFFMSPTAYLEPDWRNIYYLTVLIDDHRNAQDIHDLIAIAGVNDYDFVRSSYFQHRQFQLTGEVEEPAPDQQNTLLGEPPE